MNPTCDTPNCESCKKVCLPFTILGELGYYCSETCMEASGDHRTLGCHASDLHPGMEFSCDEGRTWMIVKIEPSYTDVESENCEMQIIAAPSGSTSLSSWETVKLTDNDKVLLHREWKG